MSSWEDTLSLTHLGSRSLLKLSLVLLPAGLCILLTTDAFFVIELVGVALHTYTCFVLPCAALLKLHWMHLTIMQQGMLLSLAMTLAGYGVGVGVILTL